MFNFYFSNRQKMFLDIKKTISPTLFGKRVYSKINGLYLKIYANIFHL